MSSVCSICARVISGTVPDWFVSTKCNHVFHNSCMTGVMQNGFARCPDCQKHVISTDLTRLHINSSKSSVTMKCVPLRANDNLTSCKPDYIFNLVMLGSLAVGKSILMDRYVTGLFNRDISCGSMGYSTQTVKLGDTTVKLIIWDTSAVCKFRSIRASHLRRADGVMLVYDVTCRRSFEEIPKWFQEQRNNDQKDISNVLVGNKADCPDPRTVSTKDGEELAAKLGIPFCETSAKTGLQVEEAFGCLVENILKKRTSKTLKPMTFISDSTSGYPVTSSNSSSLEPHYKFKVVFLGDTGVGKSSILSRLLDGKFDPKCVTTLGCDMFFKTIKLGDSIIKLTIVDTAGQERFRSITPTYFRNADGVMLVYDVTSQSTFNSIRRWQQDQRNADLLDAINVLVGNKSDLPLARQVSTNEGTKLARELGISFYETSAKDNLEVEAAFRCLVSEILEKVEGSGGIEPLHAGNEPAFRLNNLNKQQETRKKCSC